LAAASPSIAVIGINAPGSLGLGAQTRQPTNSPLPLVERAAYVLSSYIDDLKEEGIERIGMMSGSLGALPVLHCLADLNAETACCFVSAVLDPAVAVDPTWLSLFGEREHTQLRLNQMQKGTRLMFIHGERDEFTPAAECVRLIRSLPNDIDARLVLLPNEGHIFRRPESWKAITANTVNFFQTALLRDCNV
jgi:pimeloyl-ACP methyl ester carboxylesterase